MILGITTGDADIAKRTPSAPAATTTNVVVNCLRSAGFAVSMVDSFDPT
jgi:hypothetical protein